MKVTKKAFGITKNKESASIYTIRNDKGMEVTLTDFGAAIVKIVVPDKNQKPVDVVLGYDKLSQYEVNAPHFGACVGRNANRIKDAKVTIDDVTYELEKNSSGNNLHSGSKSYDRYMYEAEIFQDKEEASVEFSRFSPDMEQGLPGNFDYTITYTLTNDNELVIEYYGVSNKDTIANLTNHSYFNLNGHNQGNALEQELWIDASKITKTNEELIPTGELLDVVGTPLDFTVPKVIAKDIEADYEPMKIAHGYDHNYVLNKKDTEQDTEAMLAARLTGLKTQIQMEVFTDLPGMQFYTGNFISDNEIGKGGYNYHRRDGICLETQYFPNACNQKEFKSPLIKKGQEYESVTIYKFIF